MSRRTRSVIWTFFTVDKKSPEMAICSICKNTFSFKTSTSNLKRHMTAKHPTVSMNFTVTDPRYHLPSSDLREQELSENDNMNEVGTFI